MTFPCLVFAFLSHASVLGSVAVLKATAGEVPVHGRSAKSICEHSYRQIYILELLHMFLLPGIFAR